MTIFGNTITVENLCSVFGQIFHEGPDFFDLNSAKSTLWFFVRDKINEAGGLGLVPVDTLTIIARASKQLKAKNTCIFARAIQRSDGVIDTSFAFSPKTEYAYPCLVADVVWSYAFGQGGQRPPYYPSEKVFIMQNGTIQTREDLNKLEADNK